MPTPISLALTLDFLKNRPRIIDYPSLADIGGIGSSDSYALLHPHPDVYDLSTGFDICTSILPKPYDLIICADVLEHVFDPIAACTNIRVSLAPGGSVFLTTVFIWPIHRFPVDTYRFTEDSLRWLFRSLTIENCWYTEDPGDHGGSGPSRVSIIAHA